ncbi:MAG: GNAT family N-acetyltransferase [Halieaceae bacterium]|jgi:predicted GNAT family N-acyltransferase|nr:GNAT family N-acetyltransferase [Halieaceae bacterium]
MNKHVEVSDVSWDRAEETLRSIRERVFILEQGVPAEIEMDGLDVSATHFLLTVDTVALGCGRLLPDGRIGRMAVLREHRGKGYGRQLLQAIVAHARRHGYRRLYLHAQDHAVAFYTDAGFEPEGEPFDEAGIRHVAMALELDYRGATHFITGVDYPQPFAVLAEALADTARRQIRIYSARLDHEVFDNRALASAMTRLAKRGRLSEVKILVSDARPIVSRGHRLLEISRRLSSTVSIRVLDEHPELPEATYVVRDNSGILYKPDDRARQGFYEPDSRASTTRFVDQFDRLWRWGELDPRLRSLRL